MHASMQNATFAWNEPVGVLAWTSNGANFPGFEAAWATTDTFTVWGPPPPPPPPPPLLLVLPLPPQEITVARAVTAIKPTNGLALLRASTTKPIGNREASNQLPPGNIVTDIFHFERSWRTAAICYRPEPRRRAGFADRPQWKPRVGGVVGRPRVRSGHGANHRQGRLAVFKGGGLRLRLTSVYLTLSSQTF